jgi:hypothetical protein
MEMQTQPAQPLLLGYTPAHQQVFTLRRRGYPDPETGGFYPVCRLCDGHGTEYRYPNHGEQILRDRSWLDPGFYSCSSCDGHGWAPFSILLNSHEHDWRQQYGA